jgi:hypothetical protein
MISLRKLIRFSTGEASAKADAPRTPTREWSLEEAALHLKTTIDCVEELLAGNIDYLR